MNRPFLLILILFLSITLLLSCSDGDESQSKAESAAPNSEINVSTELDSSEDLTAEINSDTVNEPYPESDTVIETDTTKSGDEDSTTVEGDGTHAEENTQSGIGGGFDPNGWT